MQYDFLQTRMYISMRIPGILFFFILTLSSVAQIPVSGINHVALAVEDIRVSTVFYRDVIGLTPIPVPEELKGIRSWFEIAPGQELHLLAGRRTPTDHDKNGSHYSLTIPDADPVEAYLKSKGIPYHRQQRFDNAWQIYVADPDGYVIELNEPKPNR
jgi:lactoylglutathione lyase